MEKIDTQSVSAVDKRLEELRQLFPSCFTESENGLAVDFDQLRSLLQIEVVEGDKERYRFTWPGKRQAIATANARSSKTLRPDRGSSVEFDTTKNLYIEGDNLEALKLLQKCYRGKISLIYIDPPYNTGNDFVYRDDFKIDAQTFAQENGEVDEEGNRLVANKKSDGRFHTNWLNMMYPRLFLARDLLADDGVICISIDDNEISNLQKICDEIFGRNNFRNVLTVRRRIKSLNAQFAYRGLTSLNVGCESVLVYAKSNATIFRALYASKKSCGMEYTEGVGKWQGFWSTADRPTMRYEILGFTPKTGQWRNSKEKAMRAVANYNLYLEKFASDMTLEEYSKQTGITEFIKRDLSGTGQNGGVYHWEAPSDLTLRTSNWLDIEVSQIQKEFDLPFDNPKNKALLTELIKLLDTSRRMGDAPAIILDFFSGSATTAHAVMQLNAEDGGNRQFIMVQIPEPCSETSTAYQAGYKTICEIGKERIRRAAGKIKAAYPITADQLDTGFRVLRIDSSNLKDVHRRPDELTQSELEELISNFKPDRTPEDLLFQSMLNLGLPLSVEYTKEIVAKQNVFNVGENHLIACFEPTISLELVTEIAQQKPNFAVFLNSAMDDSLLANIEQVFKLYSPGTARLVL